MIERYVWKRCDEGGQVIGNLMELRNFDASAFDGRALDERSRELLETAAALFDRNPPLFVELLSKDNGATWGIFSVRDTLDELRPDDYKFSLGWVIRVDAFDTAEAQQHVQTADSDPPPGTPRLQTELGLDEATRS